MYDPVRQIDRVYNYGTFDFNSPNFYVDFVKGKLNYFLSVSNHLFFKSDYINANRSIFEQVVDFTLDQRQQLYLYLETNYLPQNRYYLYNFFFDNCATRIRDAFIKSSPKHIKIIFPQDKRDITFRQLIKPYIQSRPWLDLGINIVLGSPADKTAKPDEFMFLPDYLMEAFQQAVQIKNNATMPLIIKSHVIFRGKPINIGHSALLHPKVVFWIFLVIIIVVTCIEIKKKRYFSWIDRIIFGITGISGVLLLLLWTATDHSAFATNFNLLWAIPFHFPVVFFINRKQNITFIKMYFLITGKIMVIIILTWPLIPQQLHNSLFPLILILAIRSFNIFLKKRKK